MRFFNRKGSKPDVSEIELIRLISPDGEKSFYAIEVFVDGKYSKTAGGIELRNRGLGGGVLQFINQGTKISANWTNSNFLKISINTQIDYHQKETELYFKGETIEIEYEN